MSARDDDDIRYLQLSDDDAAALSAHLDKLIVLSLGVLRSSGAQCFMLSEQYRSLAHNATAIANVIDSCRMRTHSTPATPQ